MSRFAVLALFSACLIQVAFGQNQCGCNRISYGIPTSAPAVSTVSYSAPSYSASSTYGGSGTGQVGVSGDIGASGNTVVVGSVPVLGSVDFSGTVPASGSVSISGQCGCGCS